jgi:hypothetical protein
LLALAALACQTVTGGPQPTATQRGGPDPVETLEVEPEDEPTGEPEDEPTEEPEEEPTEEPEEEPTEEPIDEPSGEVLLEDDFSEELWGTGTDDDSSIEYFEETLNFVVYTPNWFAWSTPNDDEYEDIHMEVTVINFGTDSTTALGIMCNLQPDSSDFYYGAITPAGEYAIALAVEGEDDFFLTNDDEWASSDLIAVEADTYRLGFDCGGGTLALYVDGELIDSVEDDTYTSGEVALFVWSGEEADNTDVGFDDFLMTTLE